MSKLNHDIQTLFFPEETVWHVPIFIDASKYNFSRHKKPQIAYMPRRLPNDSQGLIDVLKCRNNISDFNFVAIQCMSQSEVAQVLRDSLIFLSFSYREGFGMPPAEAMACGCIVIGYSGNGGDEFFHEDLAYQIEDGDLINYTKTVEEVIKQYVENPELLDLRRKRASEYILRNYSRDQTKQKFLQAWDEIMRKFRYQ